MTELTRREAQAACGFGAGPDCVFDAVEEAVSGVGGDARAVVVFPPARMDGSEAALQAGGAAQGARIAGMSSDGVVSGADVVSTGCAAVAFGERFQVGLGRGANARADARAAGRAAAEQALADVDPEAGHPLLLLFVDSAAAELGDVVAGVYDVAGARVPLAGGGANAPVGGDTAAPWLLLDDDASDDCVVALAVVSPEPVALGHAHGGLAHGAPAVVTRSDGRNVLRLDGAPAERVYLETLGCGGIELSDAAFERLAILHPLGQLELDGELRLRHIHGRGSGGGLFCAARMAENAAVVVVEETPASVLVSTRAAAAAAQAALGRPARLALVFDCAARRRIVADALASSAGAAALAAALPGAPAVAGLYTRGEIGRWRGPFGDLNQEIVIAAFA